MRKELENSHFVDGTATSGKGMIDFLFDNPKTEYLLIDEVDKISRKDQTILYNVIGYFLKINPRKLLDQGSKK